MCNAYPNPFDEEATIRFGLPYESYVILDVYSVVGTRVSILYEGHVEAGQVVEVEFNKRNLADGTYIYRLNTDRGMKYGTLVTN
ncbi:MAG: T9SS type A sorting domain-containing protein [Cyclobacteriaceae bacterium]